MNKKILISLAVISVVAGITLGITGAWWTDKGVSNNQSFVSGNLNLRLSNTASGGYGDNVSNTWNVDKMVPGGTPYVSTLYMKNTGSVNADYLKFTVKNTPSISGMDTRMRITELSYAGRNLLTGGAGADLDSYVAPTTCNITVHPGTYNKITDAIASASGGEVICVGPGNYSTAWEGAVINVDKGVTIVSTDGPGNTTISTADANAAINITTDNVTIKGFTIKPGSAFTKNGAAVKITASNATIKDNIITGVRGDGTGTVKGIHIFNAESSAISTIAITNNVIKDIHDTGKGSDGIMIQGNIDGITVTHNTVRDISSVNTISSWDYALGIEDTPTCSYLASPLNVVITDNHIENITSVVEPGRGFSVDACDLPNYAYAPQVTFTRNDIVNVANDITNKDPRSGTTLNAQHNWFGDNGIAVNINGASKGEIGAIDYSNYAGGPFIGFINGQDSYANGFADLEDFERSTIIVENPDLLPNSGSYHTLKMGVQLDGPTTSNTFMGGNVGMDMTVTMGQGPAQ